MRGATKGSAAAGTVEAGVTIPNLPAKAYFKALDLLSRGISDCNYRTAAAAAHARLPNLKDWLSNPDVVQDRLDIRIPELAESGTMMAIMADPMGLSELPDLVQKFKHLADCREATDAHFEDLNLFIRNRRIVRQKSGTLKNGFKEELDIEYGHRAAGLIS